MVGYLGTTVVTDLEGTPFAGFTPGDWALKYIELYGGFTAPYHKDWVLDQVARILNDTVVIVTLATWSNGKTEYRFTTGLPSPRYIDWVLEMRGEYDIPNQEYEYEYDIGTAP